MCRENCFEDLERQARRIWWIKMWRPSTERKRLPWYHSAQLICLTNAQRHSIVRRASHLNEKFTLRKHWIDCKRVWKWNQVSFGHVFFSKFYFEVHIIKIICPFDKLADKSIWWIPLKNANFWLTIDSIDYVNGGCLVLNEKYAIIVCCGEATYGALFQFTQKTDFLEGWNSVVLSIYLFNDNTYV